MPLPAWQHVRNGLLNTVRRRPALFFPLMRLWQRCGYLKPVHLLTRDTDLVVEGYFRSANTYVAHAIQLANDDRLSIAFHSHAAATVMRAVRWHVPTLVLVRQPRDAVVSNVLKHPYVALRQNLCAYIQFYRDVLPYRDRIVIAPFEQATADVNAIIDQLNAHFGTTFAHLPDDTRTHELLAQRMNAPVAHKLASEPGKTDLPTPEKEQRKSELRAQLNDATLIPLVEQAESVYEQFRRGTALSRAAP